MDTTDMEKLRILTMWECGKSSTEIATSINKSVRTVQRWLANQKKLGNMDKKERGRRPRKTTPEEDARIIQFVKENPDLTQKEILTICNINIYKGTLRRRLHEARTGGVDFDVFKSRKEKKATASPTKKTPKVPKVKVSKAKVNQRVVNENAWIGAPHSGGSSRLLINRSMSKLVQTPSGTLQIDTNSSNSPKLTYEHQLQFSNDDNTQYSTVTYDAHESLPETSEGLHVITEIVHEHPPESVNMYSELITDTTGLVKVEFVDMSSAELESNDHSLDSSEICETKDVLAGTGTSGMIIKQEVSPSDQKPPKIESKRKRKQKSDTGVPVKEEATKKRRGRRPRSDEDTIGKLGRRKRIKTERKSPKKEKIKNTKKDWRPNGKDTTHLEKSKLLIMAECGMSTTDIAIALKKSRRTVQRWLSRHNRGLDLEKKPRGIRPRKTTSEEDVRIVQFAKANPHLSRKQILEILNIPLNKVTLKNRLNEAGIFYNSQGVKILDFSEDGEANAQTNVENDEQLLDEHEQEQNQGHQGKQEQEQDQQEEEEDEQQEQMTQQVVEEEQLDAHNVSIDVIIDENGYSLMY